MTAAALRRRTVKDLAAMAKRRGVAGWHSMRKEQLVKALLRRTKGESPRKSGRATTSKASSNSKTSKAASATASRSATKNVAAKGSATRAAKRIGAIQAKAAEAKDLAVRNSGNGSAAVRDRLVVMVRDPYWLHAYWELSRACVERAAAAMGQYWHSARPVLRLYAVERGHTTNAATKVVRDIDIHGGVNNWYIDVTEPPKSYQLEVGYLAGNGKFYALARSNIVSTPPANAAGDAEDGNWAGVAEDYERIFAMSGGYSREGEHSELREVIEERLQRPIGNSLGSRFGFGFGGVGRDPNGLPFQVDAELVVYGCTVPGARVTLRGQPVRLASDGTFSVRFSLPDRRQVLPVVASSRDGAEERTIVLAVERNTKVMEPVVREPDDQ